MRIASFDEALKSLSKLDPWLGSLGIEPKSDRWHQAIQMVEKSEEAPGECRVGRATHTYQQLYGRSL